MASAPIAPNAGAVTLPGRMLPGTIFWPSDHFAPSDIGIEPLSAVARALAGFNRDQLGSAVEVLIALMDAADGDPDAEIEDPAGETVPVIDDPELPAEEDDGDPDLEETGLEDGFVAHAANGPGCPIADPDFGVEDDPLGCDPEEDCGAEDVGELDEAENGLTPDYAIDQTTSLPDAMVIASDRAAMKPHRDRIRRNRCFPRYLRRRDRGTGQEDRELLGYELVGCLDAPSRRQLLRRKRGVPRRPRP